MGTFGKIVESTTIVWNSALAVTVYPIKKADSKSLARGIVTLAGIRLAGCPIFINNGKNGIPFVSIKGEPDYPGLTHDDPAVIAVIKRLTMTAYLLSYRTNQKHSYTKTEVFKVYSEFIYDLDTLMTHTF